MIADSYRIAWSSKKLCFMYLMISSEMKDTTSENEL